MQAGQEPDRFCTNLELDSSPTKGSSPSMPQKIYLQIPETDCGYENVGSADACEVQGEVLPANPVVQISEIPPEIEAIERAPQEATAVEKDVTGTATAMAMHQSSKKEEDNER